MDNEYLEDYNNILVQIFCVFSAFLYVTSHDSKQNYTHNVFVDIQRIYVRALTDFFSLARHRDDDVLYTDIIETDYDLSISCSHELRTFINKQTAHITTKRGNMYFNEDEYKNVICRIIRSIRIFSEILSDKIKPDYLFLLNEDIEKMNTSLSLQLAKFILNNPEESRSILCN